MTNVENRSDFELTKDTPQVSYMYIVCIWGRIDPTVSLTGPWEMWLQS